MDFSALQSRIGQAATGALESIRSSQEALFPPDLLTGDLHSPPAPSLQPLQPQMFDNQILFDVQQDSEILAEENPSIAPDELHRLRLVDGRFTKVVEALRVLKSKYDCVETAIMSHSPIQALKDESDFLELSSYLKIAQSNQNAGSEINSLAEQLARLKQSKNEEAQNHLDMYTSVQQKLVTREEVHISQLGN